MRAYSGGVTVARVRYVEELIGQDTVNTMTPATLESFRDHGQARAAGIEAAIEDAHHVIETLERMGISLQKVTDRLLEDGIALFRKSFDSLLVAMATESMEGT